MLWRLSWCADPAAVALADRHYSRSNPGTSQFMPPGRQFVLVAPRAVWGVSWPYAELVAHAWPGAMLCTIFRNESPTLSSDLIRQACAATKWKWPDLPAQGMITFIDAGKVRRKRDPGRCFRRAGFQPCGSTKAGHVVLQLLPERFPAAEAPRESQAGLFD